MSPAALATGFAQIPSCGWVTRPSPLTALPALARALGLSSLVVKRDDLLGGLHGGNKVRKLDVLLAAPPFSTASSFASVGAIGSGHLATCAAAARALGRSLEAHAFFEGPTHGVLENLAFLVSGPTRLHYYGSRFELVLRQPRLLTRSSLAGVPVIPPGGTTPAGVAGMARAGLELAGQLERAELEPPDVIYCALGTGGTVAGLALGLGLCGLRVEIRAVATVERPLVSARRVRRLIGQAAQWLRGHGVEARPELAAPIRIVRQQLGPGYGIPTAQSLAAVEMLRLEGVPLEPVYTGKAFAALLADAATGRAPARVLFWNTVRGGPLPHQATWREQLPPRLSRRLARSGGGRVGRRVVLVGAGAVAAGAALSVSRVTGYSPLPGWAGEVLRPWEAQVLAAAAQVLSGVRLVEGLTVAANVDRFLSSASPTMKSEVHQLFALLEHGTTPLGLRLSRFTRLEPESREAFLLSLQARGGLLAQAFRGVRDLVLLGTWQDSRAWPALGYRGPWPKEVSGVDSLSVPYDSFRAAPGARPRSAR